MRLNALPQATAMLLILSAGAAQAANTITTIGQHPFHQPPLRSVDDLRAMMQEQQSEVKEGLDKAGSLDIQELLEKQFPLAAIKETKYGPGTQFRWMLFKRNGKGGVKAARDLTWGGKTALDGYEFSLVDRMKCLSYTFAVPKRCGNLALLKTEQIENCPARVCADCPKECPAECRLNPDDRENCPAECKNCKAECLPEFSCHDFPLDCPAECLIHPEVPEKCPAVCKGVPEECVITCPNSDCPPVTCADCPPECASHPDYCPDECKMLDCRLASSPAVTTAPEERLPVRFLADAGYFRQSDPADYVFGRIGVEYSPFAAGSQFENISFLGMIGFAPQVKGHDGDDALLLDVFANSTWKYSKFNGWIGLGIGGWLTSGSGTDAEDSDLDIIANAGVRIYGEPDVFNVSLFVEARSAVDEFDSIAEYGRFGAGLRCRF